MTRTSHRIENLFPILACFFLSGAAGLIYQVAWSKSLGLIFGHTVYAISTVLAVFMAGLTAGSIYLGRRGDHSPNPVALYARLEFLVAATGGLSVAGLAAVRWLYLSLYSAISASQPLPAVLRFVGAALVLFIPTFLMGGTFPVLVRGITKNSANLSVRVSVLYWINTFGAVVGTLSCGFFLLPELGLRGSIAMAVVLNLASALLAVQIAKHTVPEKVLSPEPSRSVVANLSKSPSMLIADAPPPSATFLLVFFAIVGCTAFAYEIAWTRMLAISISSSTYAFTLMLAAFLAGSALGTAYFQRFATRSNHLSSVTFSWTQICTAIAALASLILFHWTPSLVPGLLRLTHGTFGGLVLAQFVTSTLTVLPVAFVFGFNFPLVIVLIQSAIGRSRTQENAEPGATSAIVGKAYAANTLGAIIGALLTGFWLVPWLGSFRVVALIACANVLLALALDLRSKERAPLRIATAGACLVLAAIIGAFPFVNNKSLLSFSAVLYGNSYHGHLTLSELADASDLVFMTDGVNDSIAVFRSDNYVALRVNGKTDASTGDARTQLLLGHLGAALHPAPRRVLIIGFGSGMTASAVARYPDVQRIDCVEIEPAVLRAAPYLETLNRGVLNDPRVHIIFDDARNFLLTSRDQYDLIVSEPSNPWIAGIATLFTTEYYAAVRARLAPGGFFVQWLQAYSLLPGDLRMVFASVAPHFGEVTLWHAEAQDLLLLCRAEPGRFRFDRLRTLWQNGRLREDFDRLDVHQPEGLAAYFSLDDSGVRKLAQGALANTDDRTLLEYHAPQSMLRSDLFDANEEMILQLRSSVLPPDLDPSDAGAALRAGVATALDANDTADARRFLDALESQPDSVARHVAEGRFALLHDSLAEAKSGFEAALKLDPNSTEAMHWLATVDHRLGDESPARSLVDNMLKANPRFLPALTDEMQFAADQSDFRTALLAQLKRMNVIPDPPASEYCRLGAIWMKLANLAEAESTLLKGILKDPYSYACHLELGELDRETQRFELARQHFELIVRFYPDYNPAVFRSLAGVYQAVDQPKAAAAILRKGLRLFPEDSDLRQALATAHLSDK